MFGKALATQSVAEASKWQLHQRCCRNSSHSTVLSYGSFPLHLLLSTSLFCHGNSLMSCHVPGLAFLFSSVTPLTPESLSPSSPCLWLCKFPWFCPAIPFRVFPKDATAEVCAGCQRFPWVVVGLPSGSGIWSMLRSSEPLKDIQCTFSAEVNPVWLLWLCWPQAEIQLKDIFLRSRALGTHFPIHEFLLEKSNLHSFICVWTVSK